jgi:tRNA U55 pseudouridine synthase TruB
MRSGKFSLKSSLTLDTLEKKSPEEIKKRIIPPAQALSSFPALEIDEEISLKVLQGKIITQEELREKNAILSDFKGKFRIIDPQGRLVAIAETISSTRIAKERGKPAWRLLRVFNLRG